MFVKKCTLIIFIGLFFSLYGKVDIYEALDSADRYPKSIQEEQTLIAMDLKEIVQVAEAFKKGLDHLGKRYIDFQVWKDLNLQTMDIVDMQINPNVRMLGRSDATPQEKEIVLDELYQRIKEHKDYIKKNAACCVENTQKIVRAQNNNDLAQEAEAAAQLFPHVYHIVKETLYFVFYRYGLGVLQKTNRCYLTDEQLKKMRDEIFSAVSVTSTFQALVIM